MPDSHQELYRLVDHHSGTSAANGPHFRRHGRETLSQSRCLHCAGLCCAATRQCAFKRMSGRVLSLPHALKGACGKGGEARHGKKAGRRNGHHSCFPHVRTSLQETHVILFSKHRLRVRGPDLADRLRGTTNPHVVRTPQPPDSARHPASGAGRCRPSAAPRVRSGNGPQDNAPPR